MSFELSLKVDFSEFSEVSTGTTRAFVSYAHAEPLVAYDLARRLSAAGVRVFFDQKSLEKGDELNQEIKKALDQVDVVYFLATETWAERPWCRAEVEYVENLIKKTGRPRVMVICSRHPQDHKFYPPNIAAGEPKVIKAIDHSGDGSRREADRSDGPPWWRAGLKPRLHLLVDPKSERLGRRQLESILPQEKAVGARKVEINEQSEIRLERIADLCFEVSDPSRPHERTAWQQGAWLGPRHILTCAEPRFCFLAKNWNYNQSDSTRSTHTVWAKGDLRLLELDEPRRGVLDKDVYTEFPQRLKIADMCPNSQGHVVDVAFRSCVGQLESHQNRCWIRINPPVQLERGAPVFDDQGQLVGLVAEGNAAENAEWALHTLHEANGPLFERALVHGSWTSVQQLLSLRLGRNQHETICKYLEDILGSMLEEAVASEDSFHDILFALEGVLEQSSEGGRFQSKSVQQMGQWVVMLHATWDKMVQQVVEPYKPTEMMALRAALLDCYAEMVMARVDGRPIELEKTPSGEWVGGSAWHEPIASTDSFRQLLQKANEEAVLEEAMGGYMMRRVKGLAQPSSLEGKIRVLNKLLERRRQLFIARKRKSKSGRPPVYMVLDEGGLLTHDEIKKLDAMIRKNIPTLPVLIRNSHGEEGPGGIDDPVHLLDVLPLLFPKNDHKS